MSVTTAGPPAAARSVVVVLLPVMAVVLVAFLVVGLALPVLPLFYVHDLAASDAWIGILGAAYSGGSVVGYVSLRQVARRRGGGSILLPALVAAAAATAALSFATWLPVVAVLALAAGIAGAGAQLAMFDAFMRTFPRELGVTFSSVDQSIQNLALVVAPNMGGFLAIAVGSRQALLVTAVVGFAAVALFALETVSVRAGRLRSGRAGQPTG